jgi:IclR family KDG regulon transcriptional repressor
VLEGVEAVYPEKVQPSPAVKILVSRTGSRLRAHCSGVGKVLLAHRDWEEVSAQLLERGMPALTPNTITTLEGLGEELERVRDRGYAHEVEEIIPGVRCAAAPIRDYPGEVAAATSPSAPACRFHPGVEELTSAIVEATRHVSEAIGSSRYGIGMISAYDRKELQKV